MAVSHPNGLEIFFIDQGVILLSDFIPIAPGDYTIEIIDPEAGPDCFDFFNVTLNPPMMLEIFAEAVFPPSEPTAMDGSALIVAIVPGVLPYTVLLNGLPYITALDHIFEVGGLGVGEYSIQIIDAEGCMSNVIFVLIPFPDIILSFGTSFSNTSYVTANEQPAIPGSVEDWRNGLWISLQYPFKSVSQEIQMTYLPPLSGINKKYTSGIVRIEHLTNIKKISWNTIQWTLKGGIGIYHFGGGDRTGMNQFCTLQSSVNMKCFRSIRLHGTVSLEGWKKLEKPVWSISIRMNLTSPAIPGRFD